MTSKRKTALALVIYIGGVALASGLVEFEARWLGMVLPRGHHICFYRATFASRG